MSKNKNDRTIECPISITLFGGFILPLYNFNTFSIHNPK